MAARERLGDPPEFALLTPMQRRFVVHYVESGMVNASASAAAAGFSESGIRVTAYRLTKNPKVRRAVSAELHDYLFESAGRAARSLRKIVDDEKMDPRTVQAAVAILDRSGFGPTQKIEQTVVVKTDADHIAELRAACAILGEPIAKALGHLSAQEKQRLISQGLVLEAEFEEVK